MTTLFESHIVQRDTAAVMLCARNTKDGPPDAGRGQQEQNLKHSGKSSAESTLANTTTWQTLRAPQIIVACGCPPDR